MKQDCNCQSYTIGGIVQHQPDCASWDNENCEFCGGEAKELFEVSDRGRQINVCEGCYDNNFTV